MSQQILMAAGQWAEVEVLLDPDGHNVRAVFIQGYEIPGEYIASASIDIDTFDEPDPSGMFLRRSSGDTGTFSVSFRFNRYVMRLAHQVPEPPALQESDEPLDDLKRAAGIYKQGEEPKWGL